MPAYPFIPLLSFEDFKNRLINEFDCTCTAWRLDHDDEPGIASLTRIERDVPGKGHMFYLVSLEPYERVGFNTIRSICACLDVPPAAFDLHLD